MKKILSPHRSRTAGPLFLLTALVSVSGQEQIDATWSASSLGQAIRDVWQLDPEDILEIPREIFQGIDSTAADVYVFNDGELITASHARALGGPAALGRALYESRQRAGEKASQATELVIFLGRTVDQGPPEKFWTSPWVEKNQSGQVGFTVVGSDQALLKWLSPIETVALNQAGELNQLRNWIDLPAAEQIEIVRGEQFWVNLQAEAEGTYLERGNQPVKLSQVTRSAVENAARLAEDWLRHNIDEEGRLLYAFRPSECREVPANNMIRQWMATLALVEILEERPEDTALAEIITRNIDYNLARFYREEQVFGLIEFDGKVKLGAVALAALTLKKAPGGKRWAKELAALDRTVSHLWQNDGSFRTFYKPRERDDNHNFYPGEALLYWTSLYTSDPDPFLLKRIEKSVNYYQSWHLENRNPAFVPWHTMAYARLWEQTADPRLVELIFRMNDWLLPMQQRGDDVLYPDMQGRFYAPGKNWGIPHVSSTAVYLEGLAAALGVAQAVKDKERSERYADAMRHGLRQLLQLQFEAPAELYYLKPECRTRVYGGFRTAVYDTTIRCDNVQHALQALRGALRHLPEPR